MNEDELYRSSTQYRLWSFTPQALADLRSSTNALASQRVRDAIARAPPPPPRPPPPTPPPPPRPANPPPPPAAADEVACLTAAEEQKLVNFYCSKAMDFSDFCGFPTSVKVRCLPLLYFFTLSLSSCPSRRIAPVPQERPIAASKAHTAR